MKELREIITDLEVLNKMPRADEVDTTKDMKEAREVIAEMKAIMRKKNLTSLSAPALGYDRRIFCINFSDDEIKTFVNPIITHADEKMVLADERCNCLPGRRFLVPRNNKISVMYTRPTGQIESREISGAAAAVFQHELNHLDGILVSYFGLEIDDEFDKATQEEREELINWYLDSMDLTAKELDKEIQADPELKQISDAIDFMTKKETGEIETEEIDVSQLVKEKEKNVTDRDNNTIRES